MLTLQSSTTTFPITRRSDGAALNAVKELHYFEEKWEDRVYYECCCFLTLEDKTRVGEMAFAIKKTAIEIYHLSSEKKDIYYGIGTQLIRVAMQCAQVFSKNCVEVYSTSDAVGFYHKMGFKVDLKKYDKQVQVDVQKRFEDALHKNARGFCFFMRVIVE